MAYVKIENNTVVQKQPNEKDGFISVHDSIVCGMIHDGGESYAKTTFSTPETSATWDQVRSKQREMITAHNDMMEIHERGVLHNATLPDSYTISIDQYQEMLTYFQTVRSLDEATQNSPQEAIDALEALSLPSFLQG